MSQAGRSIKVGAFVLFGIFLVTAGIFLIGDNRKFWDSKMTFQASFADVAGLKPGAPIRMGGIDVGTVTSVSHAADPGDPRIHVVLSVVRSEASRVRAGIRGPNGKLAAEEVKGIDGRPELNSDGTPRKKEAHGTIASVANKGLLGDKMIELSSGGVGPQVPDGGSLESEEPVDYTKYLVKLDEISNKATKIVTNIELGTRPLGDPQFSDDLRTTVHSLRSLLEGLAQNDSAAHRLLVDPKEGPKVSAILSNLQEMTGDLHEVATQVKSGPGIAHAVLYDGDLSAHAAGTLSEVHRDLQAIREGNGVAHSLVYGDDQTQHLMGNVNAMTDDLRTIVAGVKQGKGTIGGFLTDPSIYEDIKSVVGNVERNQVLRALVRYSIKADETKPMPKVDGASASASSPPNAGARARTTQEK